MLKRARSILAITIALSLILCLNVVPVNADSPQGDTSAVVPQLLSPPAGFNPLTATNQQLKEYGFPARPSDLTALQEWNNIMQHAKYYVKPAQYQAPMSLGLTQTNYDTNRAGYAVLSRDNPGNPLFTEVYGQWTQTQSPNCISYWVGLGGAQGDGIIVQAGAASCVPQNIISEFQLTSNYAFWVEDFPIRPFYEPTPVVHPGDELYVHVMNFGTQSQAFLLNESSNQYTCAPFATPNYTDVSADYMFEDSTMSPPSIDSTLFSYCWLNSTLNGFGLFTDYTYEKYIINIEAYPGPASNASFTLYCPGPPP